MPKIISNTSCLIILDNIDRLDILQKLYQRIYLTEEVAQEYGKQLENWMIVIPVNDKNYLRILNTSVDLGEASTIALSIQMTDDNVMILDDLKARTKLNHYNLNSLVYWVYYLKLNNRILSIQFLKLLNNLEV
jgi:predicted nucleic acid-binding protein